MSETEVAGTWISDEMRASVGGEYAQRTSFPISASDIRKWAQAVYYPQPPPPLYWDEAYAAKTSHGGIVAPEDFNPFAWMTAAGPADVPDATAPGSTFPEHNLGVELPATTNMLNGGIECSYTGVRMRPGDVITAVTCLTEYTERPGRLGLMLFTTTESRWTNQEGQLVKTQRDILIRY